VLFILTSINYIFNPNFGLYKIKKYLYFSQNLNNIHPSFFPEAWSLSVEEWFYLIIPILILLFTVWIKLSIKKSVLLVAVSVIVLVTYHRFYRYFNMDINNYSAWDSILRKQVFTQLDSLMYGVLGAYLSIYYKKYWLKNNKMLLILGIVIFFTLQYFRVNSFIKVELFYCVFYFSIISLATLCLLPFLSNYKTGKGIVFNAITYLSLISYSIYLWHYSIIRNWIFENMKVPTIGGTEILKYFLFWLTTILISILVYKYFELPLMKLRNKRFKKLRLINF